MNEAGFYQLLLRCRLPIAKQMESWLTGEVLPSLRKSGKYSVSPQVEDVTREKRPLEDSLLQAQIESIHEDLIGKRIANKRARLSLAIESKQAMEVFGQETYDDFKKSGREALRLACLPAEKSDGQTTAREYLLLRGLSHEQISHCQCVFGKILRDCYCQANKQIVRNNS